MAIWNVILTIPRFIGWVSGGKGLCAAEFPTAEFALLYRFSQLFTGMGGEGAGELPPEVLYEQVFLPKIPALYIHLLKLSLCLIFSSFITLLFPYLSFLLPSNYYFHTTYFYKPFCTGNVFAT